MSQEKIKCYYCQKNVYLNEGHNFHLGMVHSKCFKCQTPGCCTTLTLLNFTIANNKFYCKKHGMLEQTSSLNQRGRVFVRRTLEIPGLTLLASASSPEIMPTKIQSSRESTHAEPKGDKLSPSNKNFSRTNPNLSTSIANAKLNKSPIKLKEPELPLMERPALLRALPLVFKGTNLFTCSCICKLWHRAIWDYRAMNPNFTLRYSSGILNDKNGLFDFFTKQFRNLKHLTFYNIYLHDYDLCQIFHNRFGVNGLSSFSMKLLQSHSDITHRGVASIAEFSPNLTKFALTFLGGTRHFPSTFVTQQMVSVIATKMNKLAELEIYTELEALPLLASLADTLKSLSLSFKSRDATRNNHLPGDETLRDDLYRAQQADNSQRKAVLPAKIATQVSISTEDYSCLTMDKDGVWKFHPHVPVPIDVEAERALSRKLFATLAQTFRTSLEHLAIENTTGAWDLSGLSEGFANLKSLALSYIGRGSSLSKAWTGKSLQTLELCCVEDVGFDVFFQDNDISKNLKNLKLSTSQSKGWDHFNAWILRFEDSRPNMLESISLDGGALATSVLKHMLSTAPSLKTLIVQNCVILDEKKKSVPLDIVRQLVRTSSLRVFQFDQIRFSL